MEGTPPREGGKYMPITYVIALAIVIILLCGAVRLHMSFGLHRRTTVRRIMHEDIHQVERDPHLHEFIFGK
jgi:hypothetical protein